MNTKINIIVPVYNCKNYLERSLGSLQKQTFTDWEAICIDDGSTDGSAEVLDEYARQDGRFRIYHKKNGGAAAARNMGLKMAQAEYIAMLDADDELFPDALQNMYEAMSTTSCDLVTSEMEIVGIDGKAKKSHIPFKGYMHMLPRFFARYIRKGPVPFMYKKSVIEQYNLQFPENVTVAEDYVFTFCYGICSQSMYILSNPTYRYFYHIRNESLTMRFGDLKNDFSAYTAFVEAPKKVSDFLHAHDFDKKLKKQYDYELCRDFWLMYYMVHNAFKTKESRNQLKRAVEQCKRELSKRLPWWKQITIIDRHPLLAAKLRKIKNAIS